MSKSAFFTTILALSTLLGFTQQDSLSTVILSDLTVIGQSNSSDIHQLPQMVGTSIYAAKKSSLLVLNNVHGNVVTNTMRQVMAKVPGIFVWESDGSGIQIGIASRGLSPNRSWEFNVRQNGYDIAADPYGYPEAYYNPQLQAVQRIEFVRGQGSLQYGPQFGGMVNYILKNGSEFTKPFQVESFQTLGSNRLFNTFNAVGGKTKKLNYYVFHDHRQADGWRANNTYKTNTYSGTLTYKPSEKISFTGEFTHWDMVSQQPGGLTDAQFNSSAQQSLRARNWFNLKWQTAAFITDFKINSNQRLNIKLFYVAGDRASVGFNPGGGILVPDTINTNLGTYNPRTVDVDYYRNYGMEARYINHYMLGQQESTLSAGIRLYAGKTDRFRGGQGTTGKNADFSTKKGILWTADIDYESSNAALFVENLFRLSHRWSVIPGVRYESIWAAASGYASVSQGTPVFLNDQSRSRNFVIAGIGTEFQLTPTTQLYGNITQAYRPVQFADLTTPPTSDVVDPKLKDANGFNADIGYRGHLKQFLKFDVSVFHLQYNNRIGLIKQQREDLSFYNFRTNVGSSRTKGVEAFAELNLSKALEANRKWGDVTIFGSYAYNDARYNNLKVVTVSNNILQESNYKNKTVEYAPENIVRGGLTYALAGAFATLQYSFTGQVFTDANNTKTPTSNGQNGLIPSYSVWDFTAGYKHPSGLSVKGGINNITDARYFTRRAGGYPGPGVLPADGQTVFVTVGYVMK